MNSTPRVALGSIAALWAFAAPVLAKPFSVVSFLGGGASAEPGAGIWVSHQGFFDADGSLDPAPPSAAGFTESNHHEFDSYFALDGFGPSARGRATHQLWNNSFVTRAFYADYPAPSDDPSLGDHNAFHGIFSPGSYIGDPMLQNNGTILGALADIVSVPTLATSGFAPQVGGGRSTRDGVFVARLTIPQSATLSGGITFSILTGPGQVDEGALLLSGVDNVAGPVVTLKGQPMALTAFLVTQHADGVLSGMSDENAFANFGAARTLDLWAHVVPAPGSLALLSLAALGATRRRA